MLVTALAALWIGAAASPADELSALARLETAGSSIRDAGTDMTVTLRLTQPVPWRVRLMDAPPRLVLDFREVDFGGIGAVPQAASALVDLRAGTFRAGWSRLVLELKGPMVVAAAGMATGLTGGPAGGGTARLDLRLRPAGQAEFAARALLPDPPDWTPPRAADLPPPEAQGDGPVIVVLDPGHGGIDPGAERDGVTEAALMLGFARELKEALLRAGGFTVILTRDDDVFVPLERRVSIARAAGADVFLALHADALAQGEAAGATIYTLSDEASGTAAAMLAERHDRDDLLSGVDLTGQDDLVATVLMDMARTATVPRTDRLAEALRRAMEGQGIVMHRIPHQSAGFSVLKSPDIPSALLELGFLSNAGDLARLGDAAWRARMAGAIVQGLQGWAAADAAAAAVRRQE